MNHNAIYALYPQVVMVDDTAGAFDDEGNKVNIDMSLVNAWIDPDTYKYQRQAEYPSIQEQMDMQYWDSVNGTTTWQDTINTIKVKYPKPEGV
jgi:hypothetical protein